MKYYFFNQVFNEVFGNLQKECFFCNEVFSFLIVWIGNLLQSSMGQKIEKKLLKNYERIL